MIFKIKNKLEKAWDEVTWDISMIILILSGGSFFLCLNAIILLPVLLFFSFLSNGIEAFSLFSNTMRGYWMNYKVIIVAVIILALVFVAELKRLEIDWEQLKKDVF